MSRLISFLLLLLLTGKEGFGYSSSSPISSSSPSVTVPFQNGPNLSFHGRKITGRDGGNVDAFYGIPFGEEPERWRDPVMKRWNETTTSINASEPNVAPCTQAPSLSLVGSNDCLKLNVWKPSNASSSSRLPVMVFIHGGAFIEGGIATDRDGTDPLYQGQNLVQDTVVVTLQYRLGALGFLGSEMLRNRSMTNSTGNFGILDQRLALQWVQDNIHAFGGDADQVFLFGESAGAISVSVHLMSEASWPLFSSAGIESGAFNPYFVNPLNVTEDGYQRTLKALGCSSLDCLLNASDAKLTLRTNPLLRPHYNPTVDGVVMTQMVPEALSSGTIKQVPMLMGTNANEGTLFAAQCGGLFGALGFNTTERKLETMKCLGPSLNTMVTVRNETDKSNVSTSLSEVFDLSNQAPITPPLVVNEILTPNYWKAVAMTTAGFWECPTLDAAERLSRGKSNIYVYNFRAQTRFGSSTGGLKGPPGSRHPRHIVGSGGARHGAELISVFSLYDQSAEDVEATSHFVPNDLPHKGSMNPHSVKRLAKTMSQAWINFAKTHKPGFGWQRWTKTDANRAIFDYHTNATEVMMEKAQVSQTNCAVVRETNTCHDATTLFF